MDRIKIFLNSWKNITVSAVVVLIVFFVIGVLIYKITKNNTALADPVDYSRLTPVDEEKETLKLVARVSKIIRLPENETPNVAYVTDIEKLKGQAFFNNARNGDRILIYAQAKRAYLYRPTDNKIIEVAPINVAQKGQATSSGDVAGIESEENKMSR